MNRRKQLLAALLCAAMACASTAGLAEGGETAAQAETEAPGMPELTHAGMALLYEESTDTILYARDEVKKNAPASMTKVMTAMLVLEYDPELSGKTVVPPEALESEYCWWIDDYHLEAGEEVSVLDLMKYLLIASGNEAAVALAFYVAGDYYAFVDMMNEKAAELDMTETYYADAHGLSSKSAISARDMLTLSRYAMRNDIFRSIVGMKQGFLPISNMRSRPYRYRTTNRVMDPLEDKAYEWPYADEIVGIKTGSTSAAGYNLSCCMETGELTFYSVVMHCIPTRAGSNLVYGHYTSSIELLSWAHSFHKQGFAAGTLAATARTRGSFAANVELVTEEDAYILVQEGKAFEPEIALYEIGGAVKGGDVLGTLTLRDEFGNVRETALVAAADAATNPVPAGLLIGAGALIAAAVVVFAVRAAKGKRAGVSQERGGNVVE